MIIRRHNILVFLLCSTTAAVIAAFFPLEAIEACARISVIGVALMVSGIIPAMTLLVNTMKGKRRSPKSVNDLYEKLHGTMENLILAFIRASLFIVFILITVTVSYTDIPYTNLVQRIFLGGAVFWGLLFMYRSKIALTTFLGVLELKKVAALQVSKEEKSEFMSQAREDARLPSDNYGSKAKPLQKQEYSDD